MRLPSSYRLLPTLTALAGLWIGCASPASHPGAKSPRPSVLVISIDGLRPEFYRPGSGWNAPNLQKLALQGATAEAAEPVFPSLTYPSHTTIVTGVRSVRHGVYSNMVFSPKDGPTAMWYWDAEMVQSPTIWQRARAAGYKTAILTWPGTVGAQADWLIPEIFASPPATVGTTWELMQKYMNPALAEELTAANDGAVPDAFEPRDRWVTRAAEHVLRNSRPDFALVHLINLDHEEHENGRDSPQVRHALEETDEQLGRILAAIDLSRTTVILVGDHGFYDYDKIIRPNTLFARKGWLRPEKSGRIAHDWKVITDPGGGAAAIYVRDAKLAPRVVELLKQHSDGAYRVVEREELDRLGAFPGALCAIDPVTMAPGGGPGYSVSLEARGPFIEKLPKIRGNHGPIPSDQLMTGMIATGPGIAAGRNLGHVRLLDVAPTIASVIGVPLSEAEGSVIDLYKAR